MSAVDISTERPAQKRRTQSPPHCVVVLPAYNAAKTVREVVKGVRLSQVDRILLVDDASLDETVDIASTLRLKVIKHRRNLGYGGNQKTCYTQALAMGADIIVMIHPDGQYDPAVIPALCKVIEERKADIVLGSRWLGLDPANSGMPLWKRIGNRFLTSIENLVLGLRLSEYHTGYRAYSRRFLETIPFLENSNDFVFDTQVLLQAAAFRLRIAEVPAVGRYFPEASSVGFRRSVVYGLETLFALAGYLMHRVGFEIRWLNGSTGTSGAQADASNDSTKYFGRRFSDISREWKPNGTSATAAAAVPNGLPDADVVLDVSLMEP